MPDQSTEDTPQVLHKRLSELQMQVEELQEANERMKLTEREFRSLADNVPAFFAYVGADKRYRYVNRPYEEWFGIPRSEIVGKHVRDVIGSESYKSQRRNIEKALRCNRVRYGVARPAPLGEMRYYEITLIPDCPEDGVCEGGRARGYFAVVIDDTERRKAEERLKSVVADLDRKQIAIHEVLERAEMEIAQMKADIVANTKAAILPLLSRLQAEGVSQRYVDLIRRELDDLTSSFGRHVSDLAWKLSPREIEICDMIKDGMATKDIARLLNLSVQTVAKHRNNIRHKIGISGQDTNLATFLRNL